MKKIIIVISYSFITILFISCFVKT